VNAKVRQLQTALLCADILWCIAAMFLAYLLRYRTIAEAQEHFAVATWPFLAATWVVWALLFSWMRLDCFRGGWRFPAVVSQLFLAVSCLLGVLSAVGYLLQRYVSRLALLFFALFLLLGFIFIRYAARGLMRAFYRSSRVRKVIIVGADRLARELALKIERHPEMLCKIIGFLHPEDLMVDANGVVPAENGVAGSLSTLGVAKFLQEQQIDELILALPKPAVPEVLNLAALCRKNGIGVSLVPQPYELYLSRPVLFDLDGLPLLRLQERSGSTIFLGYKRAIDLVFGALFMCIAVPIIFFPAVILRLRKGAAFRREVRCGQNGVAFPMLRLNVLRHDPNSPLFERILEKLSISELPQLWNVLKGDMTLVGPRPEGYERARHYSEWQQQRLSVKPGITGLAQVHGMREQNSSEEKTRFDLQYLLNPTPVMDIALLLQTLWTLATRILHYPELVKTETVSDRQIDLAEPKTGLQENVPSAYRAQSGAD
jgi:lipopolysaccharide/colanic/teichoic acid biosynthesis glycosyltransferase